jgi:hypothetical protein
VLVNAVRVKRNRLFFFACQCDGEGVGSWRPYSPCQQPSLPLPCLCEKAIDAIQLVADGSVQGRTEGVEEVVDMVWAAV